MRSPLDTLCSADILAGSRVDLENFAFIDKERYFDDIARFQFGRFAAACRCITADTRIGFNDFQFNSSREIDADDFAFEHHDGNVHFFFEEMDSVTEVVFVQFNLFVCFVIHETVHAFIFIEVLHLAAVNVAVLYFFASIPGTFDNSARFEVLNLSADESSALARFYVLEFNDLPYLAVDFDSYAWSEIITCNHV